MEIHVSLKHGPLDIEIEADGEEEYKGEIIEILSFIEENEDVLNPVNNHIHSHDGVRSRTSTESAKASLDEGSQEGKSSDESPSSAELGGKFSSISRRIGIDESTLERLIDVPDDEDEHPAIIVEELEEGADSLGASRMEKQARASLILLYVWENIRGVEKVYSSDLGDALHMSGVDPSKMSNMYRAFDGDADTYFQRHGSGGPYSGVSLKRRGERVAIDEIQKIVEDMIDGG